MTDAWRECATLADLEAALLERYVASVEARAEEPDAAGLREQLADPRNRAKLEKALKPMVEKDAARLWAAHLDREGKLS